MIVDVHCHYALSWRRAQVIERFSFETPHADPEHPYHYDSCLSLRAMRRAGFRLMRWVEDLPDRGSALDDRLETDFARHLFAPGPIERYVLLAFDAVYNDDGRPLPLAQARDRFGTDLYTSNSLIRAVCQQHPDRFLFGASIHPYRPDAERAIEQVFAAGACLLKWIPQYHNIDVEDRRTQAVLRKCHELGLPLLVHYSEEFTLPSQRREFVPIGPLLGVLRTLRREGCMPCTIVPHVATNVLPWGDRRSHRLLLEALTGEFADAPLYADVSALTSWAKTGHLLRLAGRPELHHKFLFGSDFPVPIGLPRLRAALGRRYRDVAAISSWPQQAATILRLLGYQEIVFHRAAELLPNVNRNSR